MQAHARIMTGGASIDELVGDAGSTRAPEKGAQIIVQEPEQAQEQEAAVAWNAAATASQTESSMLDNVTMCRLSQPTLGLANLTLFPSSGFLAF